MRKGKCRRCNSKFNYEDSDTWIEEDSLGYGTKLLKCPECGQIHILKYFDDLSYQVNLNFDERYYTYDKH